MAFLSHRTIKLDVSELTSEIKKLREVIENVLLEKPQLEPGVDFDPDDYSSVLYTNEEEELIKQHMDRRVAGIDVGL
jgi:hypothetical protein